MKTFCDFYGCQAVISPHADGLVKLTVRNPHGSLIKAQDYATERGAKIAMGRMSESWRAVNPAIV